MSEQLELFRTLEKDFNFKPDTKLRVGLRKFAEWYRDFYELGK